MKKKLNIINEGWRYSDYEETVFEDESGPLRVEAIAYHSERGHGNHYKMKFEVTDYDVFGKWMCTLEDGILNGNFFDYAKENISPSHPFPYYEITFEDDEFEVRR